MTRGTIRRLLGPISQADRRLIFTSLSPRAISFPVRDSRSHILRQPSFRSRAFSTAKSEPGKLRSAVLRARHDYPILFPVLLVATCASCGFLALLVYDEYTSQDPAELANFTPAVKQHLRRAIWYTEIKPSATIAADSFSQALEEAERGGLDPVSPDFAGIQIRFAQALEKFGRAKGAINILDRLVSDLVQRIEEIDRGKAPPRRDATSRTSARQEQDVDSRDRSAADPTPDLNDIERTRLLKQIIQCKYKISELYRSDYIQDEKTAHRVLDETIKLLVDSMKDPRSLRFDDNRAGISASEAAAMLNAAGNSHMLQGNFGPALEIFKLALVAVRKAEKGRPSCGEALTMSHMQAVVHKMLDSPSSAPSPLSFSPSSAMSKSLISRNPVTSSPKQARQIAGQWAQQSLQCAQSVPADQQDDLCVMAAMSSWSGLATTLVELGDLPAARDMWQQVVQKARDSPALQAMVPVAETALKDLEEKEEKRKRKNET